MMTQISQPMTTLCPHCGKDDRIQRVRAYPHPRLAPPRYIEAPKPVWHEPNKPLRLLLAILLALALGLLMIGAVQTDGNLAWEALSGGGGTLVAGMILVGVMRPRRKIALRQHDQLVDAWTQRVGAERRRFQIAYSRWENDLFYCHRDDVVFLRGSPGVLPEQMSLLLS
jgi:hypothetical protein